MQVGKVGARMRPVMATNYQRRVFQAVLVLGALLFTCLVINAQSGRRGAGRSTTTAPSVSGPKEVEAKSKKPPRLQLVVGIEAPSSFSSTPYYLSDTVLDVCIRRLADASDVSVTPAGRHLTRGDASRMAKEEKDRYVVWLQLGDDLLDSSAQVRYGSNELYVNYMILEPGTAKIKRMGRTYKGIYKVGNVGVSGPNSSKRSPVYSEYALKQSAREAAEKILEAFEIKLVNNSWPR